MGSLGGFLEDMRCVCFLFLEYDMVKDYWILFVLIKNNFCLICFIIILIKVVF